MQGRVNCPNISGSTARPDTAKVQVTRTPPRQRMASFFPAQYFNLDKHDMECQNIRTTLSCV